MRTQLVIICAAVLLCACSRPTETTSIWHESPASERPYNNILVVGISDDPRQRRRFENMLTTKLEARELTVWPSHKSMPKETDVDRDSVMAAVNRLGAKAVVVSRLVNQVISTKEIADRTEIKTSRKNDNAIDFFRYDYEEYDEPAYL